jgi:non-heme chloroperoxidase
MHTALMKSRTASPKVNAFLSVALLCGSVAIGGIAGAEEHVKNVTVSGTRLSYVEHGRGDPVVLVHGAVADYRIWTAQMTPFAARHRVIAYSLRYHYPNQPADASSEYTALNHASDLAQLIRALHVAPAHVVGHSYGGAVAAYLVRDHPQLVRSLVLAEPGTFAVMAQHPEAKALGDERSVAMGRVQNAVKNGDAEYGVKAFLDYWLAPRGFSGLSGSDRALVLANASTLAPLFRGPPPAKPFGCEDARNIDKPTLLVGGDKTIRTFTVLLDELSKCMPKAERATLAGTAHGVQFESPDAFNDVVLRFLAKH